MKFLHIACLTGLLWLTGCATPVGTQDTTSNAPTTPTEAPAILIRPAPDTRSGPFCMILSAEALIMARTCSFVKAGFLPRIMAASAETKAAAMDVPLNLQ